ncbi:MAG: nitrilase-related carbon-nitrogen hydrolase [Candidatus Malihini olakiniferum]
MLSPHDAFAKETHWELLVRACALENTTYVMAINECGVRNIGNSMVVDPLSFVIVQTP